VRSAEGISTSRYEYEEHVFTTPDSLASAYRSPGNLDKAIALREESLALRRTRFDPDHPATVRTLQAVGPLQVERPVLPDHPATVRTLQGLATDYRRAGRVDQSARLLEEALPLATARTTNRP
jgi:hypothetical protein